MEEQKIIDMKNVDLNKPGLLGIEVEDGDVALLYLAGVVLKVAVEDHQPVGYFTPDHSNVQVVNRLLAEHCDISQEKIANGELGPIEWQKLDEKLPDLTTAPLFIDDSPEMSVEQISDKIRKLADEHDVCFVAIEHARKLGDNSDKDFCYVSRTLHELGKELGVIILVITNDMEQKNGKAIFTPSAEQMGTMIENAWQEFLNKAREAGYDIREYPACGWLKDVFAGGYTYGYNDGYGIIRGQLEAMNMEHESM